MALSSSQPIPRTRPGQLWKELVFSLPSLGWLFFFFLVPTLLVVLVSFHPADPTGAIGSGWTLDTWRRLGQPSYPMIVWRTFWVSMLASLLCLSLAVPIAYYVARLPTTIRRWYLLLIILPFWTNFLIRIYAWKTLLHPEGMLKETLVWLGLVDPQSQLLYNVGTVLLVTVYNYLPFAILPLYAAAQKFDFQLLEAARDLGASKLQSFILVFLPGISRGLLTALLVTLIPALGSYAIPDIVGGPGSEFIGNKIVQRVFVDRNLPHASGISTLLALAVLLPLLAGYLWQQRKPAQLQPKGG